MLRDISLKALLVAGFMLAGLLPLMIFALMSYASSRTILKDQAFQQLESIRNIKIHQLEQFFTEKKAQVRVLSRDPQLRQFFREIRRWRSQKKGSTNGPSLSGHTRGQFDADPAYREIHDRYYAYFAFFAEQHGFYDLFLITPEDGFVAFTVIKESDFGTALSDTPSPLREAWEMATESDDVVLTDTKLYQPSNNVPAQFAVMPVRNGDESLGFLAVQISMDSIDGIMGERSGMGETGETYLVGADRLMRSDSYLDPENHSVLASLTGTIEENGVDTVTVKRALQGDSGSAIVIDYNGNRVLSAYGPIHFGKFTWALMAEIDENEIDQRIAQSLDKRILLIMLLSLMLLLSLAYLISLYFNRGITRVTSEVEDLMDNILEGTLHARSDPDKVGTDFRRVVSRTNDLSDAFVNQIEKRRKMEEVMAYNQRMESIGTLAGGIAHDFNNILTYMFTYSDIIIGELQPGTPEHESMMEIQKAIHRAADLVSQIMTFSRQTGQENRPIQVSLIVKEAVKLLKATLPKSITVRKQIETEHLYVMAQPSNLYQITMNLCTNAFHAMQETGGTLTIRLQAEPGNDGSPTPYCRLSVQDTGTGMDPDTMKRIFEPYFTTKPEGQGSGMGLAVVHGIIQSLGGSIHVDSTPGEGTEIHVRLPATRKNPADKLAGREPVVQQGDARILFVDDEKAIGQSTGRLLSSWGYFVQTLTDSKEADRLLSSQSPPFNLLITDLNMPDLNGIQLVERMRDRKDTRPVLLLTGYSELLDEAKLEQLGDVRVLFKPFTSEQLANMLNDCLPAEHQP